MQIDRPLQYFEAIAARGEEPRLRHATGTWQFDIDDVGTWSIKLDHGRLDVVEGPSPSPTTRFRLGEQDFLRIARGEGHENLITTVMRGALRDFEGDIAFGQAIQVLWDPLESTCRHASLSIL